MGHLPAYFYLRPKNKDLGITWVVGILLIFKLIHRIKPVNFSGIWTQMIRAEGELGDHHGPVGHQLDIWRKKSWSKKLLTAWTYYLLTERAALVVHHLLLMCSTSRPFPASFFFIFVFSIHSKQMFNKFCRWLNSNRGPLVSEATATQPLPEIDYFLCLQLV